MGLTQDEVIDKQKKSG